MDLTALSALEQAALIRARKLSSEELCRHYLDRIERRNPSLNAFVTVMRDRALRDARDKDRQVARARTGDALPAFHGVPIGIKDLNFVRFSMTGFGSRGARLYTPIDDRTVAGLRRGGFVILGKTATSELGAMPVTEPDTHPPTRNPWHLGHSSGGSSGGAGAAVAGGLLPIAQGSDGAGSIRIPASFSGLYGIKPTRGHVPNHLGLAAADLIYSCGPIARTVDDAAAMLDVMTRVKPGRTYYLPPPKERYADLARRDPGRLRIRLLLQTTITPTDQEIIAAVERAARALESLGHIVEPVEQPEGSIEEFLPIYARLFAQLPFIRWDRTQLVTRWLREMGTKISDAELAKKQAAMARRFAAAIDERAGDLWLTPTTPIPAPRIGAFAALSPEQAFLSAARLGVFTAMYNVLGYPAASVPVGFTSAGLPIGAQLGGGAGNDGLVLAVSRQLESALPRERPLPFG